MQHVKNLWFLLTSTAQLYIATGCRQSAAALTYMTLFAIVPMMTVTYSMFSVIPSFQGVGDQLQGMIFTHFLPSSGQELESYLQAFSDQARSLTLVGVGMLLVTAYLMLKNIEQVFNTIWNVKEGRKGLSNFLLYWAVLSLGPLLLGAGLAMSTYLLSLKLLVGNYNPLGLLPELFKYFPWLMTWVVFTLLFAAVPNCRVRLRDAAIGGAVTAICFELLKDLFAVIVARSAIQVIYGAFAFVPLFLMWVYLLWMVLLAGAVLVRAINTYSVNRHGDNHPDLLAAILILWVLREGQIHGHAISEGAIQDVGLSDSQWRRLRECLLKNRYIAVTNKGRYMLGRDLDDVTLMQVGEAVGLTHYLPTDITHLDRFPWFPALLTQLRSVEGFRYEQLQLTLGTLFQKKNSQEKIPQENIPQEKTAQEKTAVTAGADNTSGMNNIAAADNLDEQADEKADESMPSQDMLKPS